MVRSNAGENKFGRPNLMDLAETEIPAFLRPVERAETHPGLRCLDLARKLTLFSGEKAVAADRPLGKFTRFGRFGNPGPGWLLSNAPNERRSKTSPCFWARGAPLDASLASLPNRHGCN